MLEQILIIINNPIVPWVISLGIIVIALLIWLIFRISLYKINRQLDLVQQVFKNINENNFTEKFNEFDEKLVENKFIFHSWKMFKQTLINETYYTVDPAKYFNEKYLISPHINLNLYQAIPNIFVGIGIWFTFIGLVAALWFASKGVAATDIIQAQAALKDLLHAATFKFVTSIAGLLVSLVFSWREKKQVYKLQQRLNNFCIKLESCLIKQN
jgi:hypothetical protein